MLAQYTRPYTDKDIAHLIGALTITRTDTLHDEKLLQDAVQGLATLHGYVTYLEAVLSGPTVPRSTSGTRSAPTEARVEEFDTLPAWRRLEILCAEYEVTIVALQGSNRDAAMQEVRKLIASRLRSSGVSIAAIASLMARSQQTVDGWLRQVAATQQRVA